ncbi:MAG TPA: RnfABCDGE type electron transport complex subunit G, partial [Cyclobacteriaceae bacterium]|nr:RnfABCDGE type electron transport complex subunit G [Cyclobacteriaceae bacterium]
RDGRDSLQFFPAKKNGELIGTAVKTSSPRGYAGDIILIVGFDKAGNILNIQVLQHTETPGLGSKMTMPSFIDQFIGVNPGTTPLRVKKDGGKVDAISGATITSRAFSEAVQLAYDTFISEKNGKQN